MHVLTAIFALIVAAAGWYYMFYSQAAHRLGGVEQEALNRKRIRLRRAGGFLMLVLGACFFAMFWSVNPTEQSAAFLGLMLVVLLLLAAIVILAMVDLRLTWKLRQQGKPPPPPPPESRP